MSELEAALLSYQKTLIRCLEDDFIEYEKANTAFLAGQRKKIDQPQVEPKSKSLDLGELDFSGLDDSVSSLGMYPIQPTVEIARISPIPSQTSRELYPDTHSRGDFTVDLEDSTNTPLPPSISKSQEKKNNGRLIKKAVAYSVTLAIMTALFYRFSLEIYLKELLLMLQKIIL